MFWLFAVGACAVLCGNLDREGIDIAGTLFLLSLLFIGGLWLNERELARGVKR